MPGAFFLTILVLLMIITGVAALFARDLLVSIILFSAFSYFAALTYLTTGAPDVAFTEAVVGVVSTTFFIVALKQLRRGSSR
ncbi:MAG TPA: DUF4040 domain-containing protein [Clostridia bacterium]|jgi:energy-converting hydrogenase B subunit D|nr:DUF4040 domain-containing protein [Clostridia bacterium]